jgi:hypothetical protein
MPRRGVLLPYGRLSKYNSAGWKPAASHEEGQEIPLRKTFVESKLRVSNLQSPYFRRVR